MSTAPVVLDHARPDEAMLDLHVTARVGQLDLAVKLAVGRDPVALIGPNGAGKSTVLKLALGIRRPAAGRIELGGQVLFDRQTGGTIDVDADVDVDVEERGFGYVPQHCALFPHMTSAQNVIFALACDRRRSTSRQRRARALDLLGELGVGHVANRLPGTLSGGEAQRVALARALAVEPRVLLLDEPFAALDTDVRHSMREFLHQQLSRLGRPTIIVTHEVADAVALAPRIAVMERGRIVQVGPLEELRERPASPFVTSFVESRHCTPVY